MSAKSYLTYEELRVFPRISDLQFQCLTGREKFWGLRFKDGLFSFGEEMAGWNFISLKEIVDVAAAGYARNEIGPDPIFFYCLDVKTGELMTHFLDLRSEEELYQPGIQIFVPECMGGYGPFGAN
jgi:hypothetical protein